MLRKLARLLFGALLAPAWSLSAADTRQTSNTTPRESGVSLDWSTTVTAVSVRPASLRESAASTCRCMRRPAAVLLFLQHVPPLDVGQRLGHFPAGGLVPEVPRFARQRRLVWRVAIL